MRPRLSLAIFSLVILVSCGDNLSGADDAGGTPDAPDQIPDAGEPDAEVCEPGPDAGVNPDAGTGSNLCAPPAAGDIGSPCTMDAECDSVVGAGDGLCVTAALPGPIRWPPEGFCSRFCAMDGDCGPNAFCGNLNPEGTEPAPVACMPRCCPEAGIGDECSPGRICTDNLLGFIPLGNNACMPGNYAATDGDPCVGFYDCNLSSNCADDRFETPGGVCRTQNCTVGDDTTCAPGSDAHCVALPGEPRPVCVDTCDTCAQDCRTEDQYACIDDDVTGVARCLHPSVGDECTIATDCGDPATWSCFTGASFPGGYCTVAGCTVGSLSTCSRTSTCHDPDAAISGDEFCATRCDPADASSCREGYTCVPDAGQDSSMNPIPGCLPTR